MKKNNNKIKYFFKNVVFTKKFGFFAFFGFLITILITMLGIKISNKFKPSFYCYQSYMSPKNIKKINQKFDYKEFGEIAEFNKAILTNKAVAGIGSDSQTVNLIKRNALKKIDYEKIFGKGIKTPKAFLRKEIWDHLLEYDEYLKTDYWGNKFKDEHGNEENRHLWQYFLPYYSQDAIIAYNPSKINKELKDVVFPKMVDNKAPMIDILKTLSKEGYDSWAITNSIRDNLIYGSAYRSKLTSGSQIDDESNGNVYSTTYELLINNFVKLIHDGTGYSVNNDKHINFKSDGLELLNLLLNPHSKINAAIMYNGDGIDAFYSEDNFKNVANGTIRYVRPLKNLLLVDGFVINNNKNSKLDDAVYDIAKQTWMSNYQKLYQAGVAKFGTNVYEVFNNPDTDENKTKLDIIFQDAMQQLAQEKENNEIEISKQYPDSEQRPTYFENGHNSGFDNFNYIGYTPTNLLEYQFVYDNYFEEDEDKDLEQRAKRLYRIEGEHISIKPISDDLFSELSVYYNKLIKG